jgi:Fic family protein
MNVLKKAEFWEQQKETPINERQRMMINRLFDDFFGNLTSSKWAKITKTSTDTALRDIKDLIAKGILQQSDSGGRSAHYQLSITNPPYKHPTPSVSA